MTDSSQQVPCPKPECEYGPMPITSVAAHYSGSKDHDGGYERAMSLIEQQSSQETQSDIEQQSETEPDSKPADGGSDPVRDAPDTPDEPTCPECDGNRWFDPSEGADELDLPDDHEVRDWDRACADCSEATYWEVYDE